MALKKNPLMLGFKSGPNGPGLNPPAGYLWFLSVHTQGQKSAWWGKRGMCAHAYVCMCTCVYRHRQADVGRLRLIHGVVKILLANHTSKIAEDQPQKNHSQKAETALVETKEEKNNYTASNYREPCNGTVVSGEKWFDDGDDDDDDWWWLMMVIFIVICQ